MPARKHARKGVRRGSTFLPRSLRRQPSRRALGSRANYYAVLASMGDADPSAPGDAPSDGAPSQAPPAGSPSGLVPPAAGAAPGGSGAEQVALMLQALLPGLTTAITEAATKAVLASLEAKGGTAPAGAPAPPVAGVPVPRDSAFAPIRNNLFDFERADKLFRLLDFAPAPFITALKERQQHALLDEVTWITSMALYLEGIHNWAQGALELATSDEAEQLTFASSVDEFRDLAASVGRITEAAKGRAAYLQLKAVTPPKSDHMGEIQSLEHKLRSQFGGTPTTGSELVDRHVAEHHDAVEALINKLIAQNSAAARLRTEGGSSSASVRRVVFSGAAEGSGPAQQPQQQQPRTGGGARPFGGRGGRGGGRGGSNSSNNSGNAGRGPGAAV